MDGCSQCGVGPNDECTMDCPSRHQHRPDRVIEFLTINDWIDYGIERGWATGACATHDGIPSTPAEDAAWEDGEDPCQPILRIWMR